MTAGRVRVFRPDRGFGFITPDDNSYDVFVRAEDVEAEGGSALIAGEPVEYQPAVGLDGQLMALAVHPLTTRADDRREAAASCGGLLDHKVRARIVRLRHSAGTRS